MSLERHWVKNIMRRSGVTQVNRQTGHPPVVPLSSPVPYAETRPGSPLCPGSPTLTSKGLPGMWVPLNLTSMVWMPFSRGMKRIAYLSGGQDKIFETFSYNHAVLENNVELRERLSGISGPPSCCMSPWEPAHGHPPFSSSVTTHSSRAPEGLWTLASILPCAPFRRTAKDAGWFTFRPDSYRGRTRTHNVSIGLESEHRQTDTHTNTHTHYSFLVPVSILLLSLLAPFLMTVFYSYLSSGWCGSSKQRQTAAVLKSKVRQTDTTESYSVIVQPLNKYSVW